MSIIGHGDIALVIKEANKDKNNFTFFCSGVSNSQETRESEYQREVDLLLSQNRDKHLVYFSSLCIYYSNSIYALHKRFMEMTVKREFELYTIMRMGNIVWGNNPHTLINFIRNKIRNREPFETRDVYRYVLEKDEFLHWIDLIPPWPCEMNIPGKRMKVKDIVRNYCYPWRKSDGDGIGNYTQSQL